MDGQKWKQTNGCLQEMVFEKVNFTTSWWQYCTWVAADVYTQIQCKMDVFVYEALSRFQHIDCYWLWLTTSQQHWQPVQYRYIDGSLNINPMWCTTWITFYCSVIVLGKRRELVTCIGESCLMSSALFLEKCSIDLTHIKCQFYGPWLVERGT